MTIQTIILATFRLSTSKSQPKKDDLLVKNIWV
jgi:hypothetical protein